MFTNKTKKVDKKMSEKIINKLVELGGNHWEKYGKNRVYFNAGDLAKFMGYDWANYNTGNISSAKLNGENTSNRQMRRVLSDLNCKLYYDLSDGLFYYQTGVGCGEAYTQEAIQMLRREVEGIN